MLWPVLALMTAVAIFAVLWPLARTNAAERTAADAEVYRDQLDEIERDRASGAIGVAEADAARVSGRAFRRVARRWPLPNRPAVAAPRSGRGARQHAEGES